MVTLPSQKHRRPLAVTIVVWVLVISALLNIVLGAFVFFLGTARLGGNAEIIFVSEEGEDLLEDPTEFLLMGSVGIAVAVVQIVIAIGFWFEKQWAWVAAVSWQALQLLIEIATPFGTPDKVPTMVFGIIIIFLLNQSDVRRTFNIKRTDNATSPKPLTILDVN